jgi:DNA-binding beta-propeller fold protein YncE
MTRRSRFTIRSAHDRRARRRWLVCGTLLALASCSLTSVAWAAPAGVSYQLVTVIKIGGEGFWDYLSVDPGAHRLYVTHGTKVVVVDMKTNAVVGEVADTPGVHGFAVAPGLDLGFASNGRDSTASIVDLKTLKTLKTVSTGENPDAILYVPGFEEVYTFNGRGHSATVFEAKSGTVVATIPLPGKPEFAVFDPAAGRVYNNIEDRNEVVAIDVKTHAVVATWPIAPGKAASGLAIDLRHHRLFIGCDNELMLMMDSADGRVLASVPIGRGVDACAFDPGTSLAFASCGDGTTTIAHETKPDTLTVVQTLPTARSARTMTLDPTSHRIYLSAADLEPAPSPAPGERRHRPNVVPGSFRVLVFGPAGE